MKDYAPAFSWLVLFAVLCAVAECQPRDNSDPAHGPVSGVVPHTDALTGCQYLSRTFGGLTPRMDGQGRQVGCRR